MDLAERFELEMTALEDCIDRIRDVQRQQKALEGTYKMRIEKIRALRKLMREERQLQSCT